MVFFLHLKGMHFLDFSSESVDYYVLLVKMTVCSFYAQLGNFWQITKITSFWGNSWRFSAGKKLPASVENHFHSETIGFVYIQYSLLQVQLHLQKKRDSSFL